MPQPGLRGGWPDGEPTRKALAPWLVGRHGTRNDAQRPAWRGPFVPRTATTALSRRGGATRPVAAFAVLAPKSGKAVPSWTRPNVLAAPTRTGGACRPEYKADGSHHLAHRQIAISYDGAGVARVIDTYTIPPLAKGASCTMATFIAPFAAVAHAGACTRSTTPCSAAGYARSPQRSHRRATTGPVPDDGDRAVRDDMNETTADNVSWPGGDAGSGGEPASPDRDTGAAGKSTGPRSGEAGEPRPTGGPAPGSAPHGDGARAGGDAGSGPASGPARRPGAGPDAGAWLRARLGSGPRAPGGRRAYAQIAAFVAITTLAAHGVPFSTVLGHTLDTDREIFRLLLGVVTCARPAVGALTADPGRALARARARRGAHARRRTRRADRHLIRTGRPGLAVGVLSRPHRGEGARPVTCLTGPARPAGT